MIQDSSRSEVEGRHVRLMMVVEGERRWGEVQICEVVGIVGMRSCEDRAVECWEWSPNRQGFQRKGEKTPNG